LIFRHEIVEHTHGLDLKENPRLLRLVDNSLEERGASLDQEWIFLVLLFVLHDPDVLFDDVVVNKYRELTDEVELALHIELIRLITVFSS
jgi:hypothetical protein